MRRLIAIAAGLLVCGFGPGVGPGTQGTGIVTSSGQMTSAVAPQPAFEVDTGTPSCDHLPAALTINSTTVFPAERHDARDATTTTWPARGYGEDLILDPATTAVTIADSPGGTNTAVQFNNDGYFEGPTVGLPAIGTDDIVFEMVVEEFTEASDIVTNRPNDTDEGFAYKWGGGGAVNFTFEDEIGTVVNYQPSFGGGTEKRWAHYISFMDRDDATSGLTVYRNGANIDGGGADPTTIQAGSLTSSIPYTIGARGNGVGGEFGGRLACASIYHSPAWLDGGTQDLVAAQRSAAYWGIRLTGATSITMTRNSETLMQVADGSYFRVARNGPSITPDGLASWGAQQNELLQSETYNTSWSKQDAGDTITCDDTAPDLAADACKLISDSTSGAHGVFQSLTPTATDVMTCWSYVKPGTESWVRLTIIDTTFSTNVFYDLSGAGAVGTVTASTPSDTFIDKIGDYYRVGMSWNGDGSAVSYRVHVADGDNDVTTAGDGAATALTLAWSQCEAWPWPTSYIPTTTGKVTRTNNVVTIGFDAMVPAAVEYSWTCPNADELDQAWFAAISSGGGSTDIIRFRMNTGGADTTWATANSTGGAADLSITYNIAALDPADGTQKHNCASLATDDAEVFTGTTSLGTDTDVDMPTVDTIDVMKAYDDTLPTNCFAKTIRVFDEEGCL